MKNQPFGILKRLVSLVLCCVLLSGCGAPSEEVLMQMCEKRNLVSKWSAQYTEFEHPSSNKTIGYGYVDDAYNDYIRIKGDVITHWTGFGHSAEITKEDCTYYAVLTCDIEGDWINEYGDDINIRNQTEKGFTISSSGMDEEVNVTFDEITYNSFLGESIMTLNYSGYMGNKKVEVRIWMEDSDTLRVYLDPPGNSRDTGVDLENLSKGIQ